MTSDRTTIDENGEFVGIDISKAHVDVGLHAAGLVRRFANDSSGLREALDWLSDFEVSLVVCEATGRLHELVARLLRAAGLPVAVVNPGRVRHFARAKGRLAKTDRIDALLLAAYAALMRPSPGQAREPAGETLSALVLRRRQLVTSLAAEKNRLQSLAGHRRADALRTSFEEMMTALVRAITAIEREIDDRIFDNPDFRSREALLRSVPGIGPVASQTLIAELPELGRLTRRQVASLAGLAPFSRDSGAWRGRRTIYGGRGEIRTVLYMATLAAIRFNPKIRDFHQRLVQQGKLPKVAITACMRKLIVTLNAMLRDQKHWAQT